MTTPELILHHFDLSPFSEKLRLVMGFKGLAWRSVKVPLLMPKPDVVALTGGYRRTPLLQIGADIYCDTALAARVIDRIAPAPSLYPADQPLAEVLAQWADSTVFWCAAAWSFQPAGAAALFDNDMAAAKAFGIDRAALTEGYRRPGFFDAAAELGTQLAMLDAQLRRGGPFLFGAAPGIADFAVAHPLWFVRRSTLTQILAPHAALNAWLDRMLAFGHGRPTPMDSVEAVALAAASTPAPALGVAPGQGFDAGMAVTIAATDYGTDPVAGTLVGLTAGQATIARDDPRAGRVHVHFPRHGFQLRKDKRTP
jgi:glutathione S-transferase